MFYLPNEISMINGEEVDETKFEIPTTVTSLDEESFYGCFELQQLSIPSTVTDIPMKILMKF